jgi:hypothetical protein
MSRPVLCCPGACLRRASLPTWHRRACRKRLAGKGGAGPAGLPEASPVSRLPADVPPMLPSTGHPLRRRTLSLTLNPPAALRQTSGGPSKSPSASGCLRPATLQVWAGQGTCHKRRAGKGLGSAGGPPRLLPACLSVFAIDAAGVRSSGPQGCLCLSLLPVVMPEEAPLVPDAVQCRRLCLALSAVLPGGSLPCLPTCRRRCPTPACGNPASALVAHGAGEGWTELRDRRIAASALGKGPCGKPGHGVLTEGALCAKYP